MIKLIIFDLDGTLVNAYPAVARSLNDVLKKNGFPKVNHAIIKRSVGWGDRNLISRFVPPAKVSRVLGQYRKHHRISLLTGTRFLPSAQSVIHRLDREGYKLAIASNRPSFFTRIILKTLKIDRCFDYVLCADKARKPKPHKEILLQILARFSFDRSQAIYVGDMGIDTECGRNAGVKTIAVLTGSSTRQEVARYKPFKIVNQLNKILPIINALNKKKGLI